MGLKFSTRTILMEVDLLMSSNYQESDDFLTEAIERLNAEDETGEDFLKTLNLRRAQTLATLGLVYELREVNKNLEGIGRALLVGK